MKTQYISTFYSLILPGDIASGGVTWHLLSKDHGQRIHVASVVIFMRLINLVALIPFAVLGVWLEPGLAAMRIPQLAAIASFAFLILCLPFFSKHAARAAQTVSETILKYFPWTKLKTLHTKLWESVHTSNQMSVSFKAQLLLYGLVTQLLFVVQFWMLACNGRDGIALVHGFMVCRHTGDNPRVAFDDRRSWCA
jgi:hypothetical protein